MASRTDAAATLIREQLRELDSERARLQRALSDLTGGRQGRRGPGRPKGSTGNGRRRAANGRRRGRRKGTRADQTVRLIKRNPGIRASEVAKKMGIQPNYLYRVLADLQKAGKVKKSGRTYSAA